MGVRDLRFSFIFSLALHALVVLGCLRFLNPAMTQPKPSELLWVEVQPKDAKRPELADDSAHKKQVVQTSRGDETQVPKPESFLGERTQTVSEETVARERKLAELAAQSSKQNLNKPTPAMDEKVKQAKLSSVPSLNQLGIPILPKIVPGSAREVDDAAQAAVGSQANDPSDYVKNMKQSDRTALNTREFVFYGYFHRIRERLDRAWVPILRERLISFHRNGRQLASNMDHTTKLLVTLNARGEIVRVRTTSESGSHDLDDAAVQAFNRAGPFPNPPRGIIDAKGEIEIPWEFVLKT